MTHDQLVERAVRWLLGTRRCAIALRECGGYHFYCHDQPDAIGWLSNSESVVVECKTSVSDCYADRRKTAEQKGERCGVWRYVMTDCPDITIARLIPGWGLLRLSGDRVRRDRESDRFAAFQQGEIALLASELRRCRRVYTGKKEVGLVDPEALILPLLEDEAEQVERSGA